MAPHVLRRGATGWIQSDSNDLTGRWRSPGARCGRHATVEKQQCILQRRHGQSGTDRRSSHLQQCSVPRLCGDGTARRRTGSRRMRHLRPRRPDTLERRMGSTHDAGGMLGHHLQHIQLLRHRGTLPQRRGCPAVQRTGIKSELQPQQSTRGRSVPGHRRRRRQQWSRRRLRQ